VQWPAGEACSTIFAALGWEPIDASDQGGAAQSGAGFWRSARPGNRLLPFSPSLDRHAERISCNREARAGYLARCGLDWHMVSGTA
jgi:hypothetical protein